MTRSQRNKPENTTKKRSLLWIGIPIAALAIILAVYGSNSSYYADRFLPNTEVNNVEISKLTVAQANEKLKESHKENPFIIQIDDQDWKAISPEDLGWSSDYTAALKKQQANQNSWSWGVRSLSSAKNENLDGATLDEARLNETLAGVQNELTAVNESRTPSQDASIKWENGAFAITPEVVGNKIDIAKAVEAIKKTAKEGKSEINLNNYVEKPAITKDDSKLKSEIKDMNKAADIKATYSINGDTFDIPTDMIRQWLTYQDGKIDLDQAQVRAYVVSLGEKYNTSSQPTTFKSTRRGEVQVPAGTYSWTIQPDDETAALTKAILEGKDFTRSPITKGSATADKPLIGKTYVEVDLQNQHMWFYKDGNVALETDIVSGKPSSATPTGVDYVWSKETNKTLRGTNDDGSKYASPVKYWMPIDWTGVGLHDSDWQPAYGGNLWQTRGSHGCINTPPDVMANLYNAVDVGTPVLVF